MKNVENQWGGARNGAGRPSQKGIERAVKMRFDSAKEYKAIIEQTSPRRRVEIIMAWLAKNAGDV